MVHSRNIRIGIDVGGTFTDAVAIDADDFSIIATVKTPTTHFAPEGVAKGVIDSLVKIMQEGCIKAEEVKFIAHGTTQATNALLEGDIDCVGVLGMGAGLEGLKARIDTQISDIEVSNGKFLHCVNEFLDTTKGVDETAAKSLIARLLSNGAAAIVASEAFSVDNPANEIAVADFCQQQNIPVSGGHEISKLYGLRARTRTAVINASILSKMLNTANMTQRAVDDAHITTPLMIMRCDGGVMKIDEVKKRPILTILSGPAAGVAGALMYERVSDGLFLEVGGTSTDISAIKNGKVMISYAQIGGHKTYVTSLDVRTVGIGGGSMVAVRDKKIRLVGPRSAHIANCGYCVYTPDPEVIRSGQLKFIRPLPGDPEEYAVIMGSDHKNYAITLSCAANVTGDVPEGDYAKGNTEAALAGIQKLADYLGLSARQTAEQIAANAADQNAAVVAGLIKDYELDKNMVILTGGGGGASTVLGAVARKLGMNFKISHNAPVISTIGAALAMVRDVVERVMIDPTEEDFLRIRAEAEQMAIQSGANPATIEVSIEMDSQLNKVRAIAIGATELTRKNLSVADLPEPDLRSVAADAMQSGDPDAVRLEFEGDLLNVYTADTRRKGIFGFGRSRQTTCVIDKKGIVKLKITGAETVITTARDFLKTGQETLREFAVYDESGERMPDVFLLVRGKITDFKGIPAIVQLASLVIAQVRLSDPEEKIALIVQRR